MVTTDTPQGNVDLGQVESWINLLHGDSTGYVHICSTLSWSGRVFSVTDSMSPLARYVQHLHDQGAKGIYMRATTVSRPPEFGERGSVADSVSLPGFWADIDLAGPGHKTKKPLPPTVAEGMRIVQEARLPQPTLWVHSGGGLYPWWLFENPIHMVAPEIVDSMQDLSSRWQDCLVSAAARIGYSYGGVGDLSRVLRIPGTINRKVDDLQAMCRIILDNGPRLADDEIEVGLAQAEAWMKSHVIEPVKPETPRIPLQRTGDAVGDRPGDDFARHASWDEILEPHGYQFDRSQGEEAYWVRPGKNRRDGHSCTTNYQGSDLLYVFSTEMDGFEANTTYTKFATWAILNHGGDMKAASKVLRAQGFGAQRPQPARPAQPFQPGPLPEQREAAVEAPAPAPIVVKAHLDKSDLGNAARLVEKFGNQFRCVGEERRWWGWNGQVWGRDSGRRIDQAAEQVTEDILQQGWDLTNASEEHQENADNPDKLRKCKCPGCEWIKFGNASRNDARIKGMISRFGGKAGIACALEDFDTPSTLVTLTNGVLDPETRQLHDFDPRRMMTRQMPVAYDPEATAPRFEQFMAQVLPSAAMRDYVQRALGYTLLGENDQRVMFQVYGPSGTGKSQFLNIFEGLFGGFGTTAPETALRETRNESSFELHSLRGKRFVTTSETSESAVMNEALIKRLTGRDNVTTRGLYESPVTWTPECVIWLATNFAPKMNSDDAAIWARVKAILFDQQFSREQGNAEPDLGKKILAEEASGILNWLLEGVRKYRAQGLGEPTEVTEAVAAQRLESDNVAQFVSGCLEEERLVKDEQSSVQTSLLYRVYVSWCRNENYAPLGQRRFNNRVEALGYQKHKRSSYHFLGLRLNGQMGLLGSMG